jgi:hypothetical protein
MNIKSLEINLFKASQIEEGDVVLIKTSQDEKKSLSKEDVKQLYKKICDITNKSIPIYFFPKELELEILKKVVIEHFQNNQNENNNEQNEN